MVPSDVLGRVFCLRIGDATATGFAIDVDGRQYLITARHFAVEVSSQSPLLILFKNQWHNLGGAVVGHASGEIDISVLTLNGVVAKAELELIPDQAILYSQEVYFLGYPYGWWGEAKKTFVGRPIPFVRKAIVSCIEDGPEGAHRNFLDGHNVAGFSGGPVIYSFDPPRHFRVTSVVSGYRFVEEPIYRGNTAIDASIRYNTGIIITYGIRHALDIIRSNPIGVSLS